jgi:RNA polymerase sigma factor (TIGR02999 family)
MPAEMGDITELLHLWRKGNPEAENALFERVLPELRRLAHYLMKGERKGHTLQATELVNQIYVRLVSAKDRSWQDRRHFFAIAARAMRRHLIDHARGRPDAEFVAFAGMEDLVAADSTKIDTAVTIDELLKELAKTNPEWCQVVEMKYFLGLTDDEAAEVLGLKLRTMQRMWRDARQWLFDRIKASDAQQPE